MSADGWFPGAWIRGSRILLRSWLVLLLMVGVGCTDRPVDLDELRIAHLSMAASFPSLANQPTPSIDAWWVTVLRPGEGVIAEEGGGVSPGQVSVTVQVSVTLAEDCEVLLVRIQLLAGGEVRYLAEQEHRICAGRTNQVPPVQLQWVGPTIGLAPGQLSFSTAQGTNPLPQTVTVANAGGGTLVWTATTDGAWLSVSPVSGSLGPGATRSLTATVASANLGPGQFQASITITDPGAANSPRTLPVLLTVMEVANSVAHGTVSADGVGLSGVMVTLAGAQVMSAVTSSSGAYSFTGLRSGSYTVSISGYPPELQFPLTSQSLSLGVSETRRVDFQGTRYYALTLTKAGQGTVTSSPAGINCGADCTESYASGTAVTLTATPSGGWRVGSWGGACSGLPANSTQCTVVMESNRTVSVTFEEIPPAPVLVRSPATMSFTAVQGGANPANQTLQISNGGGGTLSWSVADNAAWLSLSPTSGTSTGETNNVTVSVNISGLAAGTYNGTITITAAAPATGSPQTTGVTLIVDPPPTPALVRSPSSMTFNGVQGGANPGNQTLQVWNGGGGILSWSVADNAAWLSLSPTSGTSTGEKDNVTVSVNISGLAAGTYNATITITAAAPATGSPQTTTVSLTVYPVATAGPMLFTASTTGTNEIWVRSEDGSQLTQLTKTGDGTSNWDAEWSPDGTRIVFSSFRDGKNDHVYVMNADGSSQTPLTDQPIQHVYPSWSPDGSRLVFSADAGSAREIWVMNADGSGKVRLTWNESEDSQADWSPDGKSIVFFSARSGTWQVWRMDVDGSNPVRLTTSGAYDFFPAWSPDGSRIAFVSNRDGNYEIYVMNANGSGQTRLTYTSATELQPSWTPDGRIVFMSQRTGVSEIYIMDADGSNQMLVSTVSGGKQFPNVRPR